MEDEFIDEERVPKTTTTAFMKIRKQKRLFLKMISYSKRPRKRNFAYVNGTSRKKTRKSTPWSGDSTSKYHPKNESDLGFLAGTSKLKNLQGNS